MSAYTEAVDRHLYGLSHENAGLCGECPDCQRDYCLSPREFYALVESGGITEEPYFSWFPCQCCGSGLGGNRYPAHALDANNEIVHFVVCVDCLCYIANGEEPEKWEG